MRVVSRHFLDIKEDNPALWMLFKSICDAGVPVDQFTPWRMVSRSYDIVHIHWPDRHLDRPSSITAFLYTLVELVLLDIARLRGAKVVWTAHNIRAHDRFHPWIEPWCWRAMLKRVDAFISFSAAGREIVHETHPQMRNVPSTVIRDGHYRDAYPNHASRQQARAALELPQDAKVVVFFGAVRPYKSVPQLAEVFRALEDPDLRLVIAGKSISEGLHDEIEQAAGGDPRIRFDDAFIPGEQVQNYMNAADLVALPYMDILNSGSALLALSFHKPILVSGKGAMAELQEVGGADWVRLFDPPVTPPVLSEAIDWALSDIRGEQFGFEWGDWSFVAQRFIEVYQRVLSGDNAAEAE